MSRCALQLSLSGNRGFGGKLWRAGDSVAEVTLAEGVSVEEFDLALRTGVLELAVVEEPAPEGGAPGSSSESRRGRKRNRRGR